MRERSTKEFNISEIMSKPKKIYMAANTAKALI